MASGPSGRLRQSAEALAIPVGALAAAMVVFGIAMAGLGRNPLEVYELIYRGAFASAFSWQNTLARAAPLILTALCVALPAQAGLMVIGGEGALVLGGLAAAVVGHLLVGVPPLGVKLAMALAGMLAGAAWISLPAAGAARPGRRGWPASRPAPLCSPRAPSAARRRVWPVWSRWRPSTAAPTPR